MEKINLEETFALVSELNAKGGNSKATQKLIDSFLKRYDKEMYLTTQDYKLLLNTAKKFEVYSINKIAKQLFAVHTANDLKILTGLDETVTVKKLIELLLKYKAKQLENNNRHVTKFSWYSALGAIRTDNAKRRDKVIKQNRELREKEAPEQTMKTKGKKVVVVK